MKKQSKLVTIAVLAVFFLMLALFSTPKVLEWKVEQDEASANSQFQYFPVTVDPKDKTITENDEVNAFLADQHSLLGAAILSDAGNHLWSMFEDMAIAIDNAPWYQDIASVSGQFVVVKPGMRKEQVAAAFGDALDWNSKERQAFVTPSASSTLPFKEGSFYPGLYPVSLGMTPETVQTIVNDRFSDNVLSHYGTSTEMIVPLDEALTIASLIQRETVSTDGMRLLSGIIWNRLFKGMNLQIDATLQYAKANKTSVTSWWPAVTPNDKYIASPFNTYMHNGLPPTPIASPSVDAILAALNPVSTSCLYYFSDKQGNFHCSDTYAEHLSLLKEYYGN
ncbi:MAG: endolytic transglycosylase MltG [Candidatus Pacebacteria bacterium]|nr:endolytic transglycosylase MltG [Candidatus Paceibacterota bacterium]